MNRLSCNVNSSLRTLLLTWLCLGCGRTVCADAMMASTIAEVSVNDTFIRVDQKISPREFAACADILPDDLYEDLTGKRPGAALSNGSTSRRRARDCVPTIAAIPCRQLKCSAVPSNLSE